MARVLLKNVRGAFLNVFEAKAFGGSENAAYSGTFLFEPGSEAHEVVKKEINEAATEKWGAKAGDILKSLKAQNKLCLHDGAEKSQYDGFDGMMFVTARNSVQPGVFDRQKNKLTAKDGKVYSGAYYNVSLDIWPQDNQYGKRVNATLLGLQFFKDGAAFGGARPSTGDEFEALEDDFESADDLL